MGETICHIQQPFRPPSPLFFFSLVLFLAIWEKGGVERERNKIYSRLANVGGREEEEGTREIQERGK